MSHFDEAKHLNTPRLVADDTQKTVWRWDNTEPFGAGACNPDPDGDNVEFEFNLRFPGQYFDRETALHYNYFRDYDPSLGRYVESDPAGLAAGLNTYTYVFDSPLTYADSKGDIPIIPAIIVGAAAYSAYQIGSAITSAAFAWSLCRQEQEIVELTKEALDACLRRRTRGEKCDCAPELDQFTRAQQRFFTACGFQFGGAAGGAANRGGGRTPGMATR